MDWALERRRENTQAKAGARLVAGDLAMADSRFKSIETDHKWWLFFELHFGSWAEYRDVLAVQLDNEDFEAVSQAVVGAMELSEKVPAAPVAKHGGAFLKLSPLSVEAFAAIRADVAKAYNALAELGGHERVGDTIHGQVTAEEEAKAKAEDERRGSSPAPG